MDCTDKAQSLVDLGSLKNNEKDKRTEGPGYGPKASPILFQIGKSQELLL